MLGFDIPVFDFRLPGVTTISADTHKYGYSVKGTSILMFRDKELRNGQYFFMTDWSGGKYALAGHRGLAFERPARCDVGVDGRARKEGYLKYAKQIFDTAYAMQEVVRAQPELRIIGNPSFCFSFTSDEFDIYHVNDAMRQRGLAPQRPAVSQCRSHGRHPAANAGRCPRGLDRRHSRGRRLRQRTSRRAGAELVDLRRSRVPDRGDHREDQLCGEPRLRRLSIVAARILNSPATTTGHRMARQTEVTPEIVERLRTVCLGLPDSYEEQAFGCGTRWCIRTQTFAHVLVIDNGWPPIYSKTFASDGPITVLTFQSSGDELVAFSNLGHPFYRPGVETRHRRNGASIPRQTGPRSSRS